MEYIDNWSLGLDFKILAKTLPAVVRGSDHRHFKGKEVPYKFLSLEKLWKDFKKDIDQFREEYHESQKHKNGH